MAEAVTVAPEECSSTFEKFTVPGPETFDHVPVPTDGVFPASTTESPHTFWSAPASAVEGPSVIKTSSTVSLEWQLPLEISHSSRYVPPAETVAVAAAE